ncbi:MAG: hypothetical protein QXI58_06155 [Candidatus Micrarchaeia archaeon]
MKYGIGFVQQEYNKKYEGHFFSRYFTRKTSSLDVLNVADFITVTNDTGTAEIKWVKEKKEFVLFELMFHFHKCEIFLPTSILTNRKVTITNTKELTTKSKTLLDQLSRILPTFTLLFMDKTGQEVYNKFITEVERIVKNFARKEVKTQR